MSQRVDLRANWIDPPEGFDIPVLTYGEALDIAGREGLEVAYRPLLEEIKWNAVNDGFYFAPIWGAQRRGKSTLLIGQLKYIYGDWDVALDHMVYTLPDLIQRLDQAVENRQSIPLLGWDDIGVHGGKRTKSWQPSFKSFSESFDALGTLVHTLLVTLVRPDSIVPALRERYLGEILVDSRGHFVRCDYSWRLAYFLPAQPWFCKILVEDGRFYPLPPKIYEQYRVERARLLEVKRAETKNYLYATPSSTNPNLAPDLSEVERNILKRIVETREGKSLRDDVLKDTLIRNGYEDAKISLATARIEALNFAIKRGRYWIITPLGQEALHKPSSSN